MTRYTVAQLDQIEEIDDGRCLFRPVRQHFGIGNILGITAWTARAAGDRLLNEHQEAEAEPDSSEDCYVVDVRARQISSSTVRARMRRREPAFALPMGVRTGQRSPWSAGTDRARDRRRAGGGPAVADPAAGSCLRRCFPCSPPATTRTALIVRRRSSRTTRGLAQGSCTTPPALRAGPGRVDQALANLRRAVELSPSMAELARGGMKTSRPCARTTRLERDHRRLTTEMRKLIVTENTSVDGVIDLAPRGPATCTAHKLRSPNERSASRPILSRPQPRRLRRRCLRAVRVGPGNGRAITLPLKALI